MHCAQYANTSEHENKVKPVLSGTPWDPHSVTLCEIKDQLRLLVVQYPVDQYINLE